MAYTSQLPNKVWRGNRVATVAISLILSSLLMSTFVFKFYIKMTWELAFFIIAIQCAMNNDIILSSQVMYYLSELVGGATAFPILGVAATPKPGTAVFW